MQGEGGQQEGKGQQEGQPGTRGGGLEVKGQEGEVLVPQGQDGDTDEDVDEVVEQPPPPPCFTPPQVAAKCPGKVSAVCRKAAAAP